MSVGSRPRERGGNASPISPTDIVGDSKPSCSSNSGRARRRDIGDDDAGGEPSNEKRGVSTIAIASDAATPGAMKNGENIRASTTTSSVFAMTIRPGRGRFARRRDTGRARRDAEHAA